MSLVDDEIPVLTEDGRQAAGDGGDDVDVDADNSDEDGDATAAAAHGASATDEAVTDLSNRCAGCLDMNKFPCFHRIVSLCISFRIASNAHSLFFLFLTCHLPSTLLCQSKPVVCYSIFMYFCIVSDVCTKYQEAAKIVNLALQGIVLQCKVGASVLNICEVGHVIIQTQAQKIYTKKVAGKALVDRGVAFPVCISVNSVVCNHSPLSTDTLVRTRHTFHVVQIMSVCTNSFVMPVTAKTGVWFASSFKSIPRNTVVFSKYSTIVCCLALQPGPWVFLYIEPLRKANLDWLVQAGSIFIGRVEQCEI
jgi:hypothetical protein